jgi:hypothetical protein
MPTFIDGVQLFAMPPYQWQPRIVLAANRTWFVSTAGNDTTGDGSAGPWRNGQKAWNFISQTVDRKGSSPSFNSPMATMMEFICHQELW